MPSTKKIITRFYDDLWNQWDYGLLPEIVSVDIAFRGSLGVELQGRDGLGDYMRTVQSAFPDFHNRIDEMVVEWDRAAVRLTYTGTHAGSLFGVPASGRRIVYPGVAIFGITDGLIQSGWVLGDTLSMWKQIGVTPPDPAH